MEKTTNIRDQFGYIILDNNIKILNDFIQGRKNKFWMEYNGEKYLFKAADSNYESYAEVIASEIGQQMGLSIAKYDFAINNGIRGVISKKFTKNYDMIMTGDSLQDFAHRVLEMNNINDKLQNSITDIRTTLKVCGTLEEDIQKINLGLIKMWIFDGVIFESDRNSTNWAIIQNLKNTRLAPIFDCSTMCRMNNDINSLLNNLKTDSDIAALTDNIKYKLKYKNSDGDDSFLSNFNNFCLENIDMIPMITEMLSKIDVNKAIENIKNKLQPEIIEGKELNWPWTVTFWLEKLINFRVKDMMGICKNVVKQKTKLF